MKTFLVLTFALTASIALAQSPSEIVKKHEAAKSAELETWIASNPESPEIGKATDALIESYSVQRELAKVAPLLRARYEEALAAENPDPQAILMRMLQPLVALYGELGQKEEAKAALAQARTAFQSHPMSQQIGSFLAQVQGQLEQPQIGDTMEIAFTAIDGREVDLAKMKGKIVLIDFWATWCAPCVEEMPEVINAYNAHHEEGFEVLGISLDRDPGALQSFTSKNGMPWPQHFDGKGPERFAEKYGITGIPATFLIGRDGKIVAKNMRGPALEAALHKELDHEHGHSHSEGE